MLSLRDLCFVLCSRDLDILRVQKIISAFLSYYPQIIEVRNPVTWLFQCVVTNVIADRRKN